MARISKAMGTASGSTRGPQRPINQASPKGIYEPLVLREGGNDAVGMGNSLAFAQRGTAGPGSNRQVMRSGQQGQHGASNPGMAEPKPSPSTDAYYYGKR